MNKSTQPADQRVGSRVRMRRLMLNMSQTKLADALGVTFQQVQKYENGVNRISASRLQRMERVLQVPISYFFDQGNDRSGGPKNAADLETFLASRSGVSLMRSFTRIKEPKLRRRIVELVEQLGR